jgi:hypothetical protein
MDNSQGGGLRKLAFLGFASALLGSVLVHAQTVDFALSGSTLWSPQNVTALTGFIPPPEKGGVYPGASLQYNLPNHFGINFEGAFRYHKTFYNDYQPYRPIFYDVNGVFSPRPNRKIGVDFMAGVGGETVLFYTQLNPCTALANGCRSYVNSTHFLVHSAGDVRYYFWKNFFVRGEGHWNFIPDNFEFHSRNVFRMSASLGYTFGRHPAPKKAEPQK